MPKRKLTRKKIRSMIEEEREAVREYRHFGLRGLAQDEASHARYLKRLLHKR